MRESELRSSTEIKEADWLQQRLRPFRAHQIASVVPDGFPAYVRILHPARGINNKPVSWAEVAVRSGHTMHRLVQFHAIAQPTSSASPESDSGRGISPPDTGNLPPDLLKALCEVLAGHTGTKSSCWFCLWEGYGWLHENSPESTLIFTPHGHTSVGKSPPPFQRLLPPDVLAGPKLHLPCRSYFLLQGPLNASVDLGWMLTPEYFVPQSPNVFWPQDRAWCVASEIDLYCTLIAGSEGLAETLVTDPRFEAYRVFPDDPVTWDSDNINT